jgi:hypothetical protein
LVAVGNWVGKTRPPRFKWALICKCAGLLMRRPLVVMCSLAHLRPNLQFPWPCQSYSGTDHEPTYLLVVFARADRLAVKKRACLPRLTGALAEELARHMRCICKPLDSFQSPAPAPHILLELGGLLGPLKAAAPGLSASCAWSFPGRGPAGTGTGAWCGPPLGAAMTGEGRGGAAVGGGGRSLKSPECRLCRSCKGG